MKHKIILLIISIFIAVGNLLDISNILYINQLISIFTMTIFFIAYFMANGVKNKRETAK
ncbi:MAG: hypothetical protein P8107_03455 [Spirochaetia bacterium]